MKLCFNTDDYGYTRSQIDGTIYAYQNGVVTSTTMLTNISDENMEYALEKAKENPGLGIGLHLNLTLGKSLTRGVNISDEMGDFLSRDILEKRWASLDEQEVYQEFKAQIERFIKYFKHNPTHLDSHHYNYILLEETKIKPVIEKLASEYGLDVRANNERFLYIEIWDETFNLENIESIIKDNLEKGVQGIELGNHVAFVDQELFEKSSYHYQRVRELQILCSDEMKDIIKKYKIELAHY